jgi:hypothetical protein
MPDYSKFMSSIQPQQDSAAENPTFLQSTTFSILRQETKAWILSNIALILKEFPPDSHSAPISVPGRFQDDNSIYVGCGGNAYVHWRLSRFFEAEGDKQRSAEHLKHAVTAVSATLSRVPRKPDPNEIAFYTGSAGS